MEDRRGVSVGDRPEVFLHAGPGRTASTWLQHRVFPKLRGVRYLPPAQFRKSTRIIERGDAARFLVSHALNHRQIGPAMDEFSAAIPDARPILVLRRQDSWVESVYRRAIKLGRYVPFEAFLDLDDDRGARPQSFAFFRPWIQLLEDRFEHKPFVLFLDDLRAEPGRFVEALAGYVGASYDPAAISFRPVNPSYGDKPLRVMRALAPRGPNRRPPPSDNPVIEWLRVKPRRFAYRHVALRAAKLVPAGLISREPLVRPEQLERVREFYAADWQACLDYARVTNPQLWAPQK